MASTIRATLQDRLIGASDQDSVEILFDFMRRHGQSNYDESVTQIGHALQCAQLATRDDCGDEAVTAALFHDIGHLVLDEHDAQAEFLEQDLNHEEAGADLLRSYFPQQVTDPIVLHVAAKRYLCTTDADYYDRLSEASKRSFQVQGGRLSADEMSELEANPGLEIALKLRRYDDQGKQRGPSTPPIEAYAECVQRCLRSDRP